MPADVSLFEAIHTQRAIRKYRRDPVPEGLIAKVLEAATKAPSSMNSQPWRFVVLRNPQVVRWYAELYNQTWLENRRAVPNPDFPDKDEKVWNSAGDFATQGIFDVPVFIVVCSVAPKEYSSILQACQNLMLAARGLGLGTVFTTLAGRRANEVKEKLGIPPEVAIETVIPMGYPLSSFGPTRRKPVREVAYQDRWGSAFDAA